MVESGLAWRGGTGGRLEGMKELRGLGVALFGAVLVGGGALIFALADAGSIRFAGWVFQENPFYFAVIMPVALMVILYLRDRVFPGTGGTGIPQTIAALQEGPGALRDRVFSVRVAVGKVLLTALGLFSGLSIGREGPSVQLGACLMHLTGKWARFPDHLVTRGLIMGGGAAGIAAAFNAPIAGVIFAFEEIGRSFDKRNLGTILRTVVVACLVTMSVLGNYFFYGDLPADPWTSAFFGPGPWVAVVLIGVVGGALGGGFSRLLLWVMPWVTLRIRKSFWQVALAVGLASAGLVWVSGGATLNGGRDQAAAIIASQMPGYLETLPAEEAAKHLEINAQCGGAYPILRGAATFLALSVGIPGGLFDPSFSVGAGLGKVAVPWLEWTGAPGVAVVLLFIVAYFSGVVQSPITSCVILVEMTGLIAFTVPLAAAAVIGYEVSKRICPVALYEALAENFLRKEKGEREV